MQFRDENYDTANDGQSNKEKAKIVQNVRQGDPPDTEMPEASPESGTKPIPNQQENTYKKSKSELLDRPVSVECMGKEKR